MLFYSICDFSFHHRLLRINKDVNLIKRKFDLYLVNTHVSYSPCFHYKGEKWDHVEQQPFLNENWFLYNQFVNT